MPSVPKIDEVIRSSQSSQPRTILGFLFGIATVIGSMAAIVSIALVGSDLEWLIVVILGVAVVVITGIAIAVLRQTRRDPAGLMLGQITGSEYARIRQLTLGDSKTGERLTTVGALPIEGTITEEPQTMDAPPPPGGDDE